MRCRQCASSCSACAIASRPARRISFPLRDFEAYYAAGAALASGYDPYSRDVWFFERLIPGVDQSRYEFLPFVGPPFGLPLWTALAHLPYGVAALLWSAVLGAAFVFLALASLELAGGRIAWLDRIAVLGLAVAFGPLTAGIALGQVALVSAAAIGGVALAARSQRLGPLQPAAIFFGTLIAALQPNIALSLFGVARDRRAAATAGIAVFTAVTLSLVASGGLAGLTRYAGMLRDHGLAETAVAFQLAPRSVAFAFGLPWQVGFGLGTGLTVLVLVVLCAQLASRRYDCVTATAVVSAALPLLLPFVHEADLAIVFLPAVLCLRRASGGAWLVALLGTILVAVNWLDLAQRVTPLGTSAALAACAFTTAALAGLRTFAARTRSAVLAGILAAALFVVVALVSAQHPIPVWPDALPAHFRAAPHWSSAEAWGVELYRSGLMDVNPWSGFLRLLSLLGCALLWASASTLSMREERAQIVVYSLA